MKSGSRRYERGVVLLGMLLFVLLSSLAASSLLASAHNKTQRLKEAELLFVGRQFQKAIRSYYNSVPPGGTRGLPPSLEALIEDTRFATPTRHLRRIYPDPMTGKADWELVFANGGIVGVRSNSRLTPIKRAGFQPGSENFGSAPTYRDWEFSIAGQ